jgi:internalin A
MSKEEALRLIKEAAETGETWLNLIGQGLTELGQGLTELPPELFQLTNLTTLVLSGNQLSSLPPEIVQLTNLTALVLSGNPLTSLPPEIVQLTNLTTLEIDGNQLSILPPELFQLTNLTELSLSGNQLTSLPPELFQMKQLTELWRGGLKLTNLPPEIVQLPNLTTLYLDGNQLTSLPPEIVHLPKLERLYLSDNQLTSLPPEIVHLPKLERLYLSDNPLVSPPYELAEQGLPAIREYFAEVEGETKEAAEVKVILVGEGASGKTSLTRCLRGEQFNKHEATTHGIRIKRWQPACSCRELRCNLWDFGGQEIMHATHQFFLSRRSLYVLVLDGRRDERPEYWLRYIETFGGGSPVLVVLNKYDTNPSFDLNQPFLREKYPFIVDFYRTSCSRPYGIEEFRQALLEELDKVPLTKNRWPAAWFRAKERLEQMNEPRISYEKFEGILADAGVKGESTRNVLAAFLHDLGIVIHFDTFELKDHHVLDPKWVTGAVYKIINAPRIAEAKGLLRLDELEQILHWQEGDEYRYWPADHVYIIELMKQFELCYELPDKQVLIPQLLGVSEPAFAFAYSEALRFELRYEDFLPPSIMPRFIVKRHQEIADNLRWRSGVVLQHPQLDARAVVRADNEARRIHIAVTGKERKVFLALIWLTFRELHTGFEGLKVSERIPLPDEPSISVAYESLLKSEEAGIEKVFPEGARKAYEVKALLAGVHFDDQSEGERMLALAKTENKSYLHWMGEKLNRYFEVKDFELFGVKIKHKAMIEDLLKVNEK